MAGPEQCPPADQISPPARIAHSLAMCSKPCPHQLFRDRRARRAITNRGQIAEPFETVEIVGKLRRHRIIGKADCVDGNTLAAPAHRARQHPLPRLTIARHRIGRHRQQF